MSKAYRAASELLKIHALVRMARVLLVIADAADYVRKAACRKAEAIAIEAVAWCDARNAARAAAGDRTITSKTAGGSDAKGNSSELELPSGTTPVVPLG
jgi:hypothetical protein